MRIDILRTFGITRKKRCCICKSNAVKTMYHERWYCEMCFQKKQLCCICGENPVEVTRGDFGYCRNCYDSTTNQGFRRSLVVMAFVFSFILLEYFFLMKTTIPSVISLPISIAVSVGIGYVVYRLTKIMNI